MRLIDVDAVRRIVHSVHGDYSGYDFYDGIWWLLNQIKELPTIELPPHGDLIDASKLIPIYEEMKWSDDYCKECMKGAIWEVEQAPVVIPASKGESE